VEGLSSPGAHMRLVEGGPGSGRDWAAVGPPIWRRILPADWRIRRPRVGLVGLRRARRRTLPGGADLEVDLHMATPTHSPGTGATAVASRVIGALLLEGATAPADRGPARRAIAITGQQTNGLWGRW